MSYSRETALAYLSSEFDALALEAGLAVGEDGWKVVLDKTLRAAMDGDEESQEALLNYHALSRLARGFSPRVNISKTSGGDTVRKDRGQAFAQVKALLDDAKQCMKDLDLMPTQTWIEGTFDTDAYEPRGQAY